MNNNFRRPTIFEIATAYEDGKNGYIEQRPKTNVVINTNRLWYGKDSTVSAFLATAYDELGNKIDSMEGYFLEPATDYDKAKIEGSDIAIMSGTYEVIPKAEMLKRLNERREKTGMPKVEKLTYDWYIDNPPGRNCIAIHTGNKGNDTKGCFLPGTNYSYNENNNIGTVSKSRPKTEELFYFFDKYGQNGIKINVGPHLEGLHK